jgi:hypothetical protein
VSERTFENGHGVFLLLHNISEDIAALATIEIQVIVVHSVQPRKGHNSVRPKALDAPRGFRIRCSYRRMDKMHQSGLCMHV